ncbi:helix-turn-helix transcriptional regulator [Curtobacterium flaccumfaciens]|uniref:helix-turn-helix transcriptional regulator n=1 Tax=Curtobacterium flaccumfaciens TaxID=2035 RepID=UPI002175935A|nr:helix-turn-helix transcriptional regulator [Curtobacterium flaccumfaciens]MCS5495176.1 helix-turn-helix transcriptional regulator [Curtobacterium flaccumfaciens pv. flaccumfaciens]MCX2798176.1 helix-turn-helix transcriptional regulator [Curtobacterium flaccumfaciens pv. flaccumfaciens]
MLLVHCRIDLRRRCAATPSGLVLPSKNLPYRRRVATLRRRLSGRLRAAPSTFRPLHTRGPIMDVQITLPGTPPQYTAAIDWMIHPGLERFTAQAAASAQQRPIFLANPADDFALIAAPLLRRLHQQPASTPTHAWMIAAHIGDTSRALRELASLRPSFAAHNAAEYAATEQMIRILRHDCENGSLAASDEDEDAPALISTPWMANLTATEVAFGVRPRRAGLHGPDNRSSDIRNDLMSISVGLADARHLMDRGTFGQARVRANDTLSRARRAGLPLHALRAQAVAAVADGVSGDRGTAARAANTLIRAGRTQNLADIRLTGEHIRLLLTARTGTWCDVLDNAEELVPQLREAPRSVAAARIALDIAEAAACSPDSADGIIGELLDSWDPNASALHEVAYLALLAGLGGGAAGWLARSAIRVATKHEFHFDAARLQMTYAKRVSGHNEDSEAAILDAARVTFLRSGARDWASIAEERMVDAQSAEVNAQLHVPLTEQEARVAALAASGMTNKQIGAELFLSPRTVSGHLYRVFPKLGVTTRAGLRDALTASRH